MPHLQKLYEKIKERKDIALITFNVDDNPGLIEPFLRENKYSFPVIPAKSLVDSLVPQLGIPHHWIVDPSGTVRFEMVGFAGGSQADKWEAMMIETLEKGAPASAAAPVAAATPATAGRR